ncbi:hypothetical protein QQS21_006456 [Conoideocrella luteorostrata]|uniref:Amino acid transporter transmembrane domain-containing protein n=1 Tax=Conoideocrella luteorostrata TaxID=1105319 RepID=A0AAJ0FSW8_9HYPO|nr:hypothetical protein QQS21_006456 [Conoideocrella luteorostrata]
MPKEKQEQDEAQEMPPDGSITDTRMETQDAVFGEIQADGPNYRDVGWLGTTVLMMKTQIGLGVLSMPAAFDALGIVPGVLCLTAIGALTTWSNHMIGVFKLRHNEVYGIDDVGFLIFGTPGRVTLGSAFVLWYIFSAGSGMLGISIGLNAVSSHGACTAIFALVAATIAFGLGSIQTLGQIAWIAWIGLVCILTAILTVAVAVGIQDNPPGVPDGAVWASDYKVIGNPSFAGAIAALTTMVFAYAGTPAFFAIVSEMRQPLYYTRSLIICQTIVSAFYFAIGIVVYYFCGSYVASPALGSAGPLVKKISYGFALPGLLASTMLFVHVSPALGYSTALYRKRSTHTTQLPAKYLFVRIFQGSRHLTANTTTHWLSWFGITFGITLIAYIIASTIPIFNDLVSLIGALLGTLMCFQPMGAMWLYDNWAERKVNKTLKWKLMVLWSVFVIVSGTFLMVGGTYGSVVNIVSEYSGGSKAFSCADNSSP